MRYMVRHKPTGMMLLSKRIEPCCQYLLPSEDWRFKDAVPTVFAERKDAVEAMTHTNYGVGTLEIIEAE